MSGRRGSNSRPTAWKAVALPTELLPQKVKLIFKIHESPTSGYYLYLFSVGRGGFEPPKSKDNRFTVCPSWPLWYLPENHFVKEHSLKKRHVKTARFLWECKIIPFFLLFKHLKQIVSFFFCAGFCWNFRK